jgi:hypothetical protein
VQRHRVDAIVDQAAEVAKLRGHAGLDNAVRAMGDAIIGLHLLQLVATLKIELITRPTRIGGIRILRFDEVEELRALLCDAVAIV